MIQNLTTLTEWKGYLPEIERYLWAEETDFEKQKTEATNEVLNDLIFNNVEIRKEMPELVLRESGETISDDETGESFCDDLQTRLRFVVDCKVYTGSSAKSVILQGSDDNENFSDITTLDISGVGVTSVKFGAVNKFYRVVTEVPNGSIDFKAYMVESKYDALFCFKIISIIMANVNVSGEDGGYAWKFNIFKTSYNDELKKHFRPSI